MSKDDRPRFEVSSADEVAGAATALAGKWGIILPDAGDIFGGDMKIVQQEPPRVCASCGAALGWMLTMVENAGAAGHEVICGVCFAANRITDAGLENSERCGHVAGFIICLLVDSMQKMPRVVEAFLASVDPNRTIDEATALFIRKTWAMGGISIEERSNPDRIEARLSRKAERNPATKDLLKYYAKRRARPLLLFRAGDVQPFMSLGPREMVMPVLEALGLRLRPENLN